MFLNTPPNYIAQNIQTGNANAQSSVQTDISGSGSVSTHIEVSANGEKKVLDSNSPGTYSLSVGSNNNSNANNEAIISPAASPSASPTPTNILKKNEISRQSFLLNLENNIKNLFSKFFNAFKFK